MMTYNPDTDPNKMIPRKAYKELKNLCDEFDLASRVWAERFGLLWATVDAGLEIGPQEKKLYRKWMDDIPHA